MTHTYWCERPRDGEIQVFAGPQEEWAEHLAAGRAVQFYSGYSDLKAWRTEKYPQADVWYTERNGDGIGMLVPLGTDVATLPSVAMDYMAFEWIDPDKEFGTGVKVRRK